LEKLRAWGGTLRPPLRAISRCFSSSIEANPRSEVLDRLSVIVGSALLNFALARAGSGAVFAAFATSFGCLCPIVLEIAAAHPAAFSAGLRGSLAVFGKVAGPATMLCSIVHSESSLRGSDPHRRGPSASQRQP